MPNDTVFGKIIRGEIPATKVYEATGFVQFDARRVMLRVLS